MGGKRWQANGHDPIAPLRNPSSSRPTTMRGTGRYRVVASCNQPPPQAAWRSPVSARGRHKRSKSGGHLRIGRAQDSDTLDPHKTFLLVSHEIMWQIYDSLIYLDASGNVYPGAAESWAFSNDNLTVTFKLRPGLNFHDGTPLNAEAVKFTADRHVAPETASPNAFLLGPLDSVGGDRRPDRRLPLHRALRAALGGPQLLLLRAHQPDGGQEARRSLRPQSGRHRPVQVRELAARSGHSPGAQRGARLGDALVQQPGQGLPR